MKSTLKSPLSLQELKYASVAVHFPSCGRDKCWNDSFVYFNKLFNPRGSLTPWSAMSFLIHDNIFCLKQGTELLRGLAPDLYSQPVRECFNSSIGGHMRHNVDHYYCFIKGLEADVIDYDARLRDVAVETEPQRALECFDDIIDSLRNVDASLLDARVDVQMDSGTVQAAENGLSGSTYRRELQFLLSHTVHHYALIAVMAQVLGVVLDPQFGVAPSTLKHRAGIEG